MDLIENLQAIKTEKDTKIIPENIKKDIQIFDITGTYEGSTASNIYLYSDLQEMLSDSSKPEGTFGVVYEDRRTHPTAGDTLTEVFLPPVVVLSEAVTESKFYDDGTGKLMIDISSDQMYFQYMDGAYYGSTSYTSEDGITYTCYSPTGVTIKMNDYTIVRESQHGTWDDVFGEFMVLRKYVFRWSV